MFLHKFVFSFLVVLGTAFSSDPVIAFEPQDCHKIGTVTVPVTVESLGTSLVFAQNETTVTLTDAGYHINEAEVYIGDASQYHQLVSDFFALSQRYQRSLLQRYGHTDVDTSKFSQDEWREIRDGDEQGRDFYQQSIALCRNILGLANFNQQALASSNEFIEIVSVTTKNQKLNY